MKKILSTALVCALLAGCGGGGSSVAPTLPTGGSKTAQATLHFKFNNAKSISGSSRARHYVSRNTLGMGISYRATGTSAVTFGTTEAALQSPMWTTNISPGYNANLTTCTSADSTGAFSCTVVIAVPAGYDDFQITTWDAAPTSIGNGGAFPSTANDLSTAIVPNQYVQVNTSNVFNYALSGVVNSVVLSPTVTQLVSGSTLGATDAGGNLINPASVTLAVLAKDYDGNIIIGSDQFVDANGTAVTVNVSKMETDGSTGTAAPANGNVTFGTATGTSLAGTANVCGATSCTFNSPGTASVAYNGFDTQSATFSATLSGGLGGSIPVIGSAIAFTQSTNGLGVPGPLAITEFNGGVVSGSFSQMHPGPDGKMWTVDYSGYVAKTDTSGNTTEYSVPVGQPQDITAGPDGKMWFTDWTSSALFRINTDGSGLFATSLPNGVHPWGITLGNDNNLWVAENGSGYIDVMSPYGNQLSSYNVGGNPAEIAYGGGYYWITNNAVDGGIIRIDPDGTNQQNFTAGLSSGAQALGIAAGADGNMWFTEQVTNMVGKITPAGAITEYPVSGTPLWIAQGSDGNMWVALGNAVARITTAGNITYYSQGITPGAGVSGIATGGDGNIWFSEYSGGRIGKVSL